ncbi:MAG TPA: CmcJ/NvfI family oxidoreductase [Stellaceae bacterium]|nr:CmcJ/NvfI family oxidoreductase [Stellaceae bacterium]
MAEIAELDTAPATIEANLIYLASGADKLVTYVAVPGGRDERSGGGSETHRVVMHNGRPLTDRFQFEREGFRFVESPTRVANFFDEGEVRRVYYPECEALIKQVSGAKRVVVFDHTLRTGSDEQRETMKIRDVVSRVHNDYTEWSGPQRVRDIMGGEADELLRGRFAIIQVWRPINNPVESHPLAICDAQTVKPETLVVNERRYQDRTGQTYGITYDPGQRWYWFPHMRPDEALVFKVYESLTDGRARWSAHTAFVDPTSPPHARPRESIEIRTLAFF